MIIEKVLIKKFRGFENVEFELGKNITVIAGKNGTQKTTLLGILSEKFSLKTHPKMKSEKPLTGGSFHSEFSEKFKFSENFDVVGEHEWVYHFYENNEVYPVQSIIRTSTDTVSSIEQIRFWKKKDKSKGSGSKKFPVIYLSLKRLFPFGEDDELIESDKVELTNDEKKWFEELHNYIMISNEAIEQTKYVESSQKNTIGINKKNYDWKLNSAGEDNLGKILLALLSFKRLKEKYIDDYKGGLLVIDEIDASLYTGSQIKLLEKLISLSPKYDIQIIFTTHSLSILKKCFEIQKENSLIPFLRGNLKIVYLEKINKKIKNVPDITYSSIKNRLNVEVTSFKKVKQKIDVFTEDAEAIMFTKALLKKYTPFFNFIPCTLGFAQIITLSEKKVPSFIFPNSLLIFDGDINKDKPVKKKINKLTNSLILPTDLGPDELIAKFLYDLDDESVIWRKLKANDFNKAYCFNKYKIEKILNNRVDAKAWFKSHLDSFGTNASIVFTAWAKENPETVEAFVNKFKTIFNKVASEKGIKIV